MKPTLYQAVYDTAPLELKSLILQTSNFAKSMGWDYKMLTCDLILDVNDAIRIAADNLKYELLSTIQGVIWCDIDCVPQDGFSYIEDGKPHAGYYPDVVSYESIPQPDTFLCYGPCEWWGARWNEAKAKGRNTVSCWPRKQLRDNKDMVQIPREQYTHGMFTCNKQLAARRAVKKEQKHE